MHGGGMYLQQICEQPCIVIIDEGLLFTVGLRYLIVGRSLKYLVGI